MVSIVPETDLPDMYLPGEFISFQGNGEGRVFAVCLVNRRWWEIWRPPVRQVVVEL